MNPLLEAALDYGRRGWPVLPLRPCSKLPATEHGLHDATTDLDVLRSWWARWPSANVGLRTGVAFDVVDIDGMAGFDALNAHRLALGEVATWGPESRTGGGGWHLLHLQTGAGNRAGMLDHVDYRGEGGYIVAPPSMHASGTPYSWADNAGPDEPLEPLPDWIEKLVNPPRASVVSQLTTSTTTTGARSTAYATRALEAEVGRLSMAVVGQRNHQLNASAFALGQLVGGRVLTKATVIDALATAAARAGLGDREIEKTVASGITRGMAKPRGCPQ